jgi:hypothetical protein
LRPSPPRAILEAMNKNVPHPPDARKEPGHSRESVRLDPPAPPHKAKAGHAKPAADAEPEAGAQAQADGYSDDVKNPPGSQQNRR